MVSVARLCWLHLALHPSGFASFCIGYCLVGSALVCLHLPENPLSNLLLCLNLLYEYPVYSLSDFVAICLNMLPSAVVCLFYSRSSPYLCDSVLCTCLISQLSACSALVHLRIYVILCYAPDCLLLFVYLCSDLSAA
ncbi:hypothetical protein Tco_1526243, partial [Tanacetum coccineum]